MNFTASLHLSWYKQNQHNCLTSRPNIFMKQSRVTLQTCLFAKKIDSILRLLDLVTSLLKHYLYYFIYIIHYSSELSSAQAAQSLFKPPTLSSHFKHVCCYFINSAWFIISSLDKALFNMVCQNKLYSACHYFQIFFPSLLLVGHNGFSCFYFTFILCFVFLCGYLQYY